MKKKLRALSALVCAAVCLGLLAGCAPAGSSEPAADVVTAGLTGRTNALVSKLEPAAAERYGNFNFRTVLDDTIWYSAGTSNGREVYRIEDVDFTLVQTYLDEQS